MNPKVSVIMGIYNCENTLRESIDSILGQTYENWELIMCDDASTDATKEIAKLYADKYENIIVIENKSNKGLSTSLNNCLKVATGEYIARVDADDICLPNRFERQVEFLNSNIEYGVVGSWVITFDENKDKCIRKLKEIPQRDDLTYGVPFAHPTIMMRKEIYDDLGGYTVSDRTKRGQDLDLWFRFYHKNYKGYNLQEPLYKYREGIDDYKRRTVKTALGYIRTSYYGFKLLELPKYKYIYLLKPLIAACIPNKVMYMYHKKSR